MKQNEKAISAKDGSNKNLPNGQTMKSIITNNQSKIKTGVYLSDTNRCSFCSRDLTDGAIRFGGIGACLRCHTLSHQYVNNLQQHFVNYFENFGGAK